VAEIKMNYGCTFRLHKNASYETEISLVKRQIPFKCEMLEQMSYASIKMHMPRIIHEHEAPGRNDQLHSFDTTFAA
jgi:hypothetical protein